MTAKEKRPRVHWWRGAVIYQVYLRSFADSDGDGIGDLRGLLGKLDYIAELGVDAIWICPFFTSPMKDFGYDVSDYRAVDPLFGTLGDFDAVVAKAHKLGLKVFIDQVLSHSSDEHPWFKESRKDRTNPKADWYVWADAKRDGSPPNNWLSVFGGSSWAWEPRRRQYYLHNFLSGQPDLNFHNRAVRDALLDVLRFWLERGVDGFRLDAFNYGCHDPNLRDNPPAQPEGVFTPGLNPYEFQEHKYDKTQPELLEVMREMRALFDQYCDIATLGEVGAHEATNAVIAQYTSGGDKLDMCYGGDLQACGADAAAIRRAVEGFEAQGKGWICGAFGNHDAPRVATRFKAPAGDQRIGPLTVALLTSLRGSACLYQGEELSLADADLPFEELQDPFGIAFYPDMSSRDNCRTPHPWTAAAKVGFTRGKPWLTPPTAHRRLSVAVQARDPKSGLNRVRAFLRWRKSHPALIEGAIAFLDAPAPCLAFVRTQGGEKIVCAFNLSPKRASFELPASARALAGHGMGGRIKGRQVILPGYGAFFGAGD